MGMILGGIFDEAEKVGFEPTVPLQVHLFSRQTQSATLAPLHVGCMIA